MITKKIKHNEKETCKLCKKEIDTSKDNWCAIIDYAEDSQISIGFYHRNCLNDLLKGKGEVMRKNFEEKLRNFTRSIVGNINVPNIQ